MTEISLSGKKLPELDKEFTEALAPHLTETEKDQIKAQEGITKSCASCRHVTTCYLYRMAVQGITAFNEEAGELCKFPMKPEAIALTCTQYESPLDVMRKTEIAHV